MTSPWDLYDQLIDEIPADITVAQIHTDGKWRRVATSDNGVGMAFGMNVQSRPRFTDDPSDLVGRPLREVAALAKSWNFEDAGIGMAAVNAYHSHPVRALAHGFRPCKENNWARTFHPYAPLVVGKRVAVIGHFPFAPAAMPDAAELNILERNVLEGDYPDSACEYLLPEMDYVFISGSAFVNKTMPRLLALASEAHTVVLGPSAPASPAILQAGATTVMSFASAHPDRLEDGLAGRTPPGHVRRWDASPAQPSVTRERGRGPLARLRPDSQPRPRVFACVSGAHTVVRGPRAPRRDGPRAMRG